MLVERVTNEEKRLSIGLSVANLQHLEMSTAFCVIPSLVSRTIVLMSQ